MSVQESFDRIAVLKVFATTITPSTTGSPTLKQVDQEGTAFQSKMGDGSPGFRILFRIEKQTSATPTLNNNTTITIYNVGPDSRAKLSQQGNILVLEAGYGFSPEVIFRGEITRARTRKQGADYITVIEASDGNFAFQNSVISQSFQAGVQTNQVIKTLVDSLKGAGLQEGVMRGIPNDGYNQGVVFAGSTVQALHEVCEKRNLNFSIQDGKITILPYDSDIGKPVVLLSPSTGLIGIPEIRELTAGFNPTGLENSSANKSTSPLQGQAQISFKCLLNPKIGMFQQVLLSSKFVNGLFTTYKVILDGDTFGGPWFNECEAA